MSDSGDHQNTLLQKLHDETGHNFPRMFLDFNEFGVIATMQLEAMKIGSMFYSEYSEWSPINERLHQALDAAVLSSASKDGKMRNSFLINRYQAVLTQNMPQEQNKPGFFDGLGSLFGGKKNNGNVGQQDLARL